LPNLTIDERIAISDQRAQESTRETRMLRKQANAEFWNVDSGGVVV